jgi:LysM domain
MQRLIISLICCLLPALALADATIIREDAPDKHVVVKGDTLWDISAKFLKSPWKWPQLWGMNKDIIRNPHWIYPGQVIVLDRATGTAHLEGAANGAEQGATPSRETVILSPKGVASPSEHGAIPSIPLRDLAPFLSEPLVVGDDTLDNGPRLVGTYEQRVILGNDDIAYVKGLPQTDGATWQVYRAGKKFVDPDTNEVLGHEAIYLGDARVEKQDAISTIKIIKSVREINKGDLLIQAPSTVISSYPPHAPDGSINGQIISIYGGVSQGGQDSIVTLNKGTRDGVENGHVLALYRRGETTDEGIKLPDTRYGLMFIFRTFEKVSYGVVLQSALPVELQDRVQTP